MTSLTQNSTTSSSCNNYGNYTDFKDFCWYYEDSISTLTWIIVCVSLPLTSLAIFFLCIKVCIL